ncbi:hypothetical protein INR49_008266 [Caranx melampygus]|nr:hypothetical protein INR49_008266 [Caranx melampygus]
MRPASCWAPCSSCWGGGWSSRLLLMSLQSFITVSPHTLRVDDKPLHRRFPAKDTKLIIN